MPVPKYDEMMVPVLKALSTGNPVSTKELRTYIIKTYGLDEEAISELITSGVARYTNNMLWACTYLKQAGLITSPKRGVYQILPEGKKLLQSGISSLNRHGLMKSPQFQNFIQRSKKQKILAETQPSIIKRVLFFKRPHQKKRLKTPIKASMTLS